jgi:thiol-disulfide isomerase/thioredoxin
MIVNVLGPIFRGAITAVALGVVSCSDGVMTREPPERVTSGTNRVTFSTNEEILALFEQPEAAAVVANFWATWCVPCREEMPELIRFYREYSPRGVSFVSVSVDDPEAPEDDLLPFMEEMGIPFHVHVPGMDQTPGELILALDPNWGGGLPATFVFDRSGTILRKWLGPVEFTDLVEAVDPLLEG